MHMQEEHDKHTASRQCVCILFKDDQSVPDRSVSRHLLNNQLKCIQIQWTSRSKPTRQTLANATQPDISQSDQSGLIQLDQTPSDRAEGGKTQSNPTLSTLT